MSIKNVKNFIEKSTKNFGLDVEFKEDKAVLTDVTVTVKVSTQKIIKDLFKKTGADEKEVNALSKIPSVVVNLLRGILANILGNLQNAKQG